MASGESPAQDVENAPGQIERSFPTSRASSLSLKAPPPSSVPCCPFCICSSQPPLPTCLPGAALQLWNVNRHGVTRREGLLQGTVESSLFMTPRCLLPELLQASREPRPAWKKCVFHFDAPICPGRTSVLMAMISLFGRPTICLALRADVETSGRAIGLATVRRFRCEGKLVLQSGTSAQQAEWGQRRIPVLSSASYSSIGAQARMIFEIATMVRRLFAKRLAPISYGSRNNEMGCASLESPTPTWGKR